MKFESWKELFQWIADGRSYFWRENYYSSDKDDYYIIKGGLGFFSKPEEKPQPKKLYACKNGHQIVFYTEEFIYDAYSLKRALEYDITYPEEK